MIFVCTLAISMEPGYEITKNRIINPFFLKLISLSFAAIYSEQDSYPDRMRYVPEIPDYRVIKFTVGLDDHIT